MSKTYSLIKFYRREHAQECLTLNEAIAQIKKHALVNTQDCYIELWEQSEEGGVMLQSYDGAAQPIGVLHPEEVKEEYKTD